MKTTTGKKPSHSCTVVGERVPRIDARGKVTGEAIYAGDIRLSGCLVGWVVSSPAVHGDLRKIDVTAARALTGVHAVLTAEDIPGKNELLGYMSDQQYLASDRVRSIADPVCLIAAESEDIARKASELIQFDVDPLPIIQSPEEALRASAPEIHAGGNIAKQLKIERGDVAAGFDAADVVEENTYTTQVIEQAYLEPEAAVAYVDEHDVLEVIVGCHSVHQERVNLSNALGLPPERIRVVMPTMGGSFGGKDDHLISTYVGLLALHTSRPVRIVWSRPQSFLLSFKRHRTTIRMKTGATRAGLLTAIEADLVFDTGAYAHWGPSILAFASCQAIGPYNVPNVLIEARAVYTNNLRAGAMRGWGTPQVAFAWESQMDRLAAELNLHPLEFRWMNAVDEGSASTTGGPLPAGVGLRDTIRMAADLARVRLPAPES